MYEDRVMNGAALLDRVNPGWAWKIETGRWFAMSSCRRCILGQLYDNYCDGLWSLGPVDGDLVAWSEAHGFSLDLGRVKPADVADTETMDWYRRLADAWRAEIRKRASATSETPA